MYVIYDSHTHNKVNWLPTDLFTHRQSWVYIRSVNWRDWSDDRGNLTSGSFISFVMALLSYLNEWNGEMLNLSTFTLILTFEPVVLIVFHLFYFDVVYVLNKNREPRSLKFFVWSYTRSLKFTISDFGLKMSIIWVIIVTLSKVWYLWVRC